MAGPDACRRSGGWRGSPRSCPPQARCSPPSPSSSSLLIKHGVLFSFSLQLIKGQCHEIFDFRFFSWISFPQAPDYPIRAVLNFNSWRYSQLKVHYRCQRHQWQMGKFINKKSFNYFVWTPLSSRVYVKIVFFLQVHFRCRRPLPYRGCIVTCEYFREFLKKFKMILMLFSGAWRKAMHEKNLKQNLLTLSLQVYADGPSGITKWSYTCSVMLFSIELRTSLKYHKSHARLIPICFTHCQFGEERVLKGGIF